MDIKVSGLIYPVIAIIEKAIVLGDIATIKKEAIQLGYLCCVHHKNRRKQEIFQHHLSEIELAIPTLEQIGKEVATYGYVLASYVCILYLSLYFAVVAFYDSIPAMW